MSPALTSFCSGGAQPQAGLCAATAFISHALDCIFVSFRNLGYIWHLHLASDQLAKKLETIFTAKSLKMCGGPERTSSRQSGQGLTRRWDDKSIHRNIRLSSPNVPPASPAWLPKSQSSQARWQRGETNFSFQNNSIVASEASGASATGSLITWAEQLAATSIGNKERGAPLRPLTFQLCIECFSASPISSAATGLPQLCEGPPNGFAIYLADLGGGPHPFLRRTFL